MYAFAQERYSEAIVAFHKALASRADDYEVHHYLARSYLALGKFPQALRAIEHALELAPKKDQTRSELYEVLGIIHTARYTSRAYSQNQQRDVEAARAAFEQATALNPHRATAYYNLGLLHGYRKEVDQAQAAYTAALAADSTLAPAYKKLGKIQREKGFPPEAATAFKKAVRFDPQDAEAHFLLGLAQRDMGDNEAALQALLKATELNPDSPKLRLNLGNVYLRLGRREEGKREMARSESLRQQHRGLHSEISPPAHKSLSIGSARDHYNMGLKHQMAGETDQALLEFRRAVEIKPDHKDAHIGLGLLLAEQGRHQLASHYFQRAIELDPENPVLYVHHRQCSLSVGITRKGGPNLRQGNPTRHLPRRASLHARFDRRPRAPVQNSHATFCPSHGPRPPIRQGSLQSRGSPCPARKLCCGPHRLSTLCRIGA